ncbi:MAG: nucleotidyltransferase domain-containing protein [Planctomycetes bacterium]|nr:nucleotidyltransferase domain-containing protein [Planctomycetota bacterium]
MARFVAVFGSRVTGGARPDSDVDVAWLPQDPDVTLAKELELQASLTATVRCDVDLVRVDRASTLCRMEIARHGELLCGDRDAWIAFRAAAIAEFLDFEPALRSASRRFAARLRDLDRGGAA